MASPNEVANAIVLANACQLVVEVVREIAGNEISNHFQGSPVTTETVTGLALAAINKEIGAKNHAK